MRITPYIILLLASINSFAQEMDVEQSKSSNIEPFRSSILPRSTALESDSDAPDALRYVLPLEDWSQQIATAEMVYASTFEAPFSWLGRQAVISIESASAPYRLLVDGREVGYSATPAMPAQFNITNYLRKESESTLQIVMDLNSNIKELEGWSDVNTPSLGAVTMLSQPTMYIRDLDVATTRSFNVLTSNISIIVKSEALNARTSRINYELISPRGDVVTRGHHDINLDMRREDTIRLSTIIPDSLAWSIENPNQYRLNLSTQYRGRHLEYLSFLLGLRSVELGKGGELMINGVEQSLKAVEMSSLSDFGQMMEAKERGYNTVKVAAGVYNASLYNYADSIGLYIIATAPINSSKSGDNILRGGNPTNDPQRVFEYIERTDAMYNTTKRHPSVVGYSLAENSLNGINLYESYLYLKQREKQRPIIYDGSSGEWNSDLLLIEF
ncbi:MAG: glycoside hydrolase family 2 TIM barrel-domain containing protein [Rikenellaceae bacterium]